MIKPFGLIAAIGVAILGTLAWGFVASITGYEFGFLAWAIGGAIGISSYLFGSRGIGNGVLCAVLTLMSIAVGKLIPYQLVNEETLVSIYLDEWLTEEYYEEIMLDAEVFSTVQSESEYPEFMIERGYTPEKTPEDISEEDVEYFKEEYQAMLEWAQETQPDYETWRVYMNEKEHDYAVESAQHTMEETGIVDHIQLVKDGLDPKDLIFVGLGVITAFGLGKGKEDDDDDDDIATEPNTAEPTPEQPEPRPPSSDLT